ncbi:MAG: hypothetical protein GX094_08775 [Clostridiales bacterium]|nr:hypothetical protein [Clostridiales bacterium]
MGIFGGKKKSKEEKYQEKMNDFMERYHLEDIDEKDLLVLQRIANDLFRKEIIQEETVLAFANVVEQAKISYLSVLTEQNWMIIRQLNKLNKNIEKLLENNSYA